LLYQLRVNLIIAHLGAGRLSRGPKGWGSC
jgi:hypothetical protein